ncbi:MAG: hypothetical protein ABIT01_05375 [Thermoanaerobaculia bacterium]
MTIPLLLSRLGALTLWFLDRTGTTGRLDALDMGLSVGGLPFGGRAPWLVALLASGLIALYASLASGPESPIRAFRALAFLTAAAIPIAAFRLLVTPAAAAFLGVLVLLSLGFAAAHRALASRRGEGSAARTIARTHRFIETLGLALFSLGLLLVLMGRPVPLALAFWALFLLQLSMANRIGPLRLAEQTGLKKSAIKDLKSAVGARGPRRRSHGRTGSLGRAAGKFLLVGLWLLLPLAAALVQREVALGEWPEEALWLRHYPAIALAAAALLLLAESLGSLATKRLAALHGLVLGTAAGLYLLKVYGDPAFAAYRRSIPGAYLAGTLLAFLLRTAESRRGKRRA